MALFIRIRGRKEGAHAAPSFFSARVKKRALHSRGGARCAFILSMAAVLVGACMIAYPFASDYLNKLQQAQVSEGLAQAVSQTSEEDLSVCAAQAQAYNARLLSGATYVVDPFDPNAPSADDAEYLSCLNLNGDGAMGQIVIPSISVSLPIYHGTEGEEMNHGVGHVVNTSLPIGGASTHAVLAGHTGLPSAVIFDSLNKLSQGDYFIIQVLGEDHAYRVTSTEVVLPDDSTSLGVEEGADLVTLVTCTPYGVNSHRLLVHAQRCDVPQDWLDRKASGDTGLPFPYGGGVGSLSPLAVGLMAAASVLAGWFCARAAKRLRKRVRARC